MPNHFEQGTVSRLKAEMTWDRPLDFRRDRMVFAVGPNSPATVRIALSSALVSRHQPGTALLTKAKSNVAKSFDARVRQAWARFCHLQISDGTLRMVSTFADFRKFLKSASVALRCGGYIDRGRGS